MKRALQVTALLAMGLLVAGSHASAQDASKSSGGEVTVSALTFDDVSSSKFQEYRVVPKGIAVPFLNLFSTNDRFDVHLLGSNVAQDDQRYTGWFNTSFAKVAFDYNQILHNMGNNGQAIESELGTGLWSMDATTRGALEAAVDPVPAANRTVPFYDALLAPIFASTNSIDISDVRKRGTVEAKLGANLPFDLAVTYMREVKTGYRGASGGNILGGVTSVIELPEPLDELTQDFGLRGAYNFNLGNVHAAFSRNVYNNRAETFVFDNPFQGADQVYAAASGTIPPLGGPASARFVMAPDNEATNFNGGFLLKFGRQTRIGGDVSTGRWTQDAAFYPHTINSVITTTTGVAANTTAALQQPSFDGKVDTTTVNFTFASKPIAGLWVRAHYRSYDLTNKTDRYVITGDTSGAPDRNWGVVTPTPDDPYGHATANVYDNNTKRFEALASYDIGAFTVEGLVRTATLSRTSREAESGKDNGYAFSAVYHASDLIGLRASFDSANRTAEGTTTLGFQADEADRDTKRTVLNVEITPLSSLELMFAYTRRNVDYPDRPSRVAGVPDTTVGLLDANYDSWTAEASYTPNERTELDAFYTYEKDTSTNRWITLTSGAINNSVKYDGEDKTDTFGVNGVFQLVPDRWTCTVTAQHQNVDGLMDVTANPNGSFYTSRATVGGPQPITDYDDTTLTTFIAQVDYSVAKAWTMGLGYWYEKYDFKDAYTSGDLLMPQTVLIFMKADNGDYKANVFYARLTYHF